MKSRNHAKLGLLLLQFALVCFFAGCATVTGGVSDKVSIESEPSGALVKINGVDRGHTPLEVELARKHSHLVELTLPGYAYYDVVVEPRMNGAVYGNIVAGGVIGMMVDESNGSGNSLYPSEIRAVLEKK